MSSIMDYLNESDHHPQTLAALALEVALLTARVEHLEAVIGERGEPAKES